MNKFRCREDMVEEFHRTTGLDVGSPMTAELLALRMKLIAEEFNELMDELEPALSTLVSGDEVNHVRKSMILKEISDLEYVLAGFKVAFGWPYELGFLEVHDSNMSKLDDEGKPIYREDGKVLKSKNYKAPNMVQFFTRQT